VLLRERNGGCVINNLFRAIIKEYNKRRPIELEAEFAKLSEEDQFKIINTVLILALARSDIVDYILDNVKDKIPEC
jgi:hypothetical protein